MKKDEKRKTKKINITRTTKMTTILANDNDNNDDDDNDNNDDDDNDYGPNENMDAVTPGRERRSYGR